MYSQEDVDEFIKHKTGIKRLTPSDDLLNDKRVGGDDFHELIDEYAAVFNVDMTTSFMVFSRG